MYDNNNDITILYVETETQREGQHGNTIILRHHYTPSPLHTVTITHYHQYTLSPLHTMTITLRHHYTPSPLHTITITNYHHYTPSPLLTVTMDVSLEFSSIGVDGILGRKGI